MSLQTAQNSAAPVAAFRRKVALDLSPATGHAAGIVFVAPDGDILLCRRSPKEKNYGGHWALPGGKVEDAETALEAAGREAKEELGLSFDLEDGPGKLLDQRITPTGMAFHTFAYPVREKFSPKLNSEHVGYAWVPLDELPRPLHPAVEATLKERVGGDAKDFAKWAAEPERTGATDSALTLALDRDSVREFDDDGRLHIKVANISKATVNPYKGHEIPSSEELGLDPNKVYYLLRDPEELRKATPTANGIQILRKHTPVSAEDHQPWDTVGATGTHAEFEPPFLKNSLVIWSKGDIDEIDSSAKKELSCGYRYRADMTPGVFEGKNYDGVMRDIVFNHVALVKDGRAGPDVVVGDSNEEVSMSQDAVTKKIKAISARTASVGALVSYLKPRLALDAKIDFGKVFDGVTGKTFAAKRSEIAGRIKSQAKLAKDANLDDVEKVLELLDKHEVSGGDEVVAPEMNNTIAETVAGMPDVPPATPVGELAGEVDGLKAFLKEKGLSDEDVAAACAMIGKKAATDESAEEKAKREKEEKDKAAADEAKVEEAKKDKEAKDAQMKDMVTKPAMDAAIKAATDATAKTVRETERGIREALQEVRPFVGELSPSMAFDSGDAVRRHALAMLGVPEAKTIHESALKTVLSLQPKPGARPADVAHLAMDAASTKEFGDRFPDAGRIGAA